MADYFNHYVEQGSEHVVEVSDWERLVDFDGDLLWADFNFILGRDHYGADDGVERGEFLVGLAEAGSDAFAHILLKAWILLSESGPVMA